MVERGKYIVIEGADGTGKSEQAKAISSRLEQMGRKVLYLINPDSGLYEPIQEPGGVPIANELRKIIKNGSLEREPWEDVLLFTAARRANWLQAMKPALDAGIDVVTARSYVSTIAYQGYASGISIEKIRERTRLDVGEEYMEPDLELILAIENEDLRQSLIAQRGPLENPDTFEMLPPTWQDDMKNGYLRFAAEYNKEVMPIEFRPTDDPIERQRSIDRITNAIWPRVRALYSLAA